MFEELKSKTRKRKFLLIICFCIFTAGVLSWIYLSNDEQKRCKATEVITASKRYYIIGLIDKTKGITEIKALATGGGSIQPYGNGSLKFILLDEDESILACTSTEPSYTLFIEPSRDADLKKGTYGAVETDQTLIEGVALPALPKAKKIIAKQNGKILATVDLPPKNGGHK